MTIPDNNNSYIQPRSDLASSFALIDVVNTHTAKEKKGYYDIVAEGECALAKAKVHEAKLKEQTSEIRFEVEKASAQKVIKSLTPEISLKDKILAVQDGITRNPKSVTLAQKLVDLLAEEEAYLLSL